MKNEIVEKNAAALASLYEASIGAGTEEADKDSFAIPFLQVLQGLSPQIESVDGAKPGLIINTITNELFKELFVIPCYFARRFLRWGSRENGGGLKGEYSPLDVESGRLAGAARDSLGRYTIEGDELKDTRQHYVLFQSANGAWSPALLSLSSTQIKKSKRWMSRIQGLEIRRADGTSFNPPSFSHIYKVTTCKEENNKGSWYGINVDLHGAITEPALFQKAQAFYESVRAGEVEVQKPTAETPF